MRAGYRHSNWAYSVHTRLEESNWENRTSRWRNWLRLPLFVDRNHGEEAARYLFLAVLINVIFSYPPHAFDPGIHLHRNQPEIL